MSLHIDFSRLLLPITLVFQLPVGHGSLNHALAGAVFTALVAAKALLPSRQEDDDVVDGR